MSVVSNSVSTSTVPSSQTVVVSDGLIKSLSMMAVGSLLIFFVGFANVSALHNAAHDTRHTASFPCH